MIGVHDDAGCLVSVQHSRIHGTVEVSAPARGASYTPAQARELAAALEQMAAAVDADRSTAVAS